MSNFKVFKRGGSKFLLNLDQVTEVFSAPIPGQTCIEYVNGEVTNVDGDLEEITEFILDPAWKR